MMLTRPTGCVSCVHASTLRKRKQLEVAATVNRGCNVKDSIKLKTSEAEKVHGN